MNTHRNNLNNKFFKLQYSASCKCDVCECLITYADFLQIKELDYLVCGSFECKRIMSQKSKMVPLHFKSYLINQKKRLQTSREQAALREAYIQKIKKHEKKQNQTVLQTFLDSNPQYLKTNVQLVRIPSGLTKLSSPSNERITKYSEHLSNIINEALDNIDSNTLINAQDEGLENRVLTVEQRFSKHPELRTIADGFCGMCKGGCCPSGNDHAYLSAATIKRLMKNKPELTTAEIRELYLSKIKNKTVKDSCINQTKQGCSLPRFMRSDTCNGYYCDSVKSYLEHEADQDIDSEKQMRKPLEKTIEKPIRKQIDKHSIALTVQWSNTNWNRFDPSVDNKIVKAVMITDKEILPIA
ncbi:hypothetical protein OO007_16595 [Cocleimonas sp. KMM 6892]|uniref:hypothetical protein n=1 Tax=unclassified Cocleimonas TaxID=2639732 RepID=UPI002DBD927B|nr:MULTISPECIES: hypothetical protein [unclassified Cocleimonas]MEB8433858.1 hypothetical protein [Cocleimonas sp. KMM 6892]MEC4716669.1 hypothetical protein [Cocleimonas sp. KMM 6895]MEC4746176.1 hypothetical protein [Cocleimonas sp. KMM 6896]